MKSRCFEDLLSGLAQRLEEGELDGYEKLILEALYIRGRKRHDYSGEARPWDWNFDFAARFASLVRQKSFSKADAMAVLIGIKFARFVALRGTEPLNESRWDTAIDVVNYTAFLALLEALGDAE